MRVLVAGFKHETNTFASNRADWAAFERGESFPKPTHGDAMLEMISKVDVSASGFASVAKRHGWTLVPSLWAGAVPSSYITDDAFERICVRALHERVVTDQRLRHPRSLLPQDRSAAWLQK